MSFKRKTAQRIVDNLRALKAAAAMDKGVGLDGCVGEPATRKLLGWRLHVASRIERSGMMRAVGHLRQRAVVDMPERPTETDGFCRNVIDRLLKSSPSCHVRRPVNSIFTLAQ
jgi:hypothetical protein